MPITIVYLLNILTTASNNANRIFLALFALQLGASPLTVGVLGAAFSVFPMLLAVPVGRLHDRFGSRWLLLFATVVAGLGMVVPAFWPSLPTLAVAALASGLASIFFNICTQNLTGLLSTPDTRARYFSNYSLSNSIAQFLGPLFGGLAIDHLGGMEACLALAGLALSPMLVLALRRSPLEPAHAASRQTVKGEDKKAAGGGAGGVWALLRNPDVRTALFAGGVLSSGFNLYMFYMPVYMNSVGISGTVIGLVMGMQSAAALVVRVLLPRLIARWKEARVLTVSFFLGAVMFVLFPFFQDAWMLGALSFLFGLVIGVGQPIVAIQMFANSAEGRSGEALGLKITTGNITKLVSPVAFGAVASAFGLGPMFWLCALMLWTGSWLSSPSRPKAGK